MSKEMKKNMDEEMEKNMKECEKKSDKCKDGKEMWSRFVKHAIELLKDDGVLYVPCLNKSFTRLGRLIND